MKRVWEVFFASLMILALWTGNVRGTTAFDTKDGCTTPSQIEALIGWRPAYHLVGKELEEFHKHYAQKYKVDAPADVDEILVWQKKDEPKVLLFIGAFKGCVTHKLLVTEEEFLEIYEGRDL